jgi:excisionase family DNA binding protein
MNGKEPVEGIGSRKRARTRAECIRNKRGQSPERMVVVRAFRRPITHADAVLMGKKSAARKMLARLKPRPWPASDPISTHEVMAILGCSLNSVQKRILFGVIPAIRVGRRYWVYQRELKAYIESAKTLSATGPSNRPA